MSTLKRKGLWGRIYRRADRIYKSTRQGTRWLFGRAQFLSDVYYGFMRRAFSREHRAVLHGIFMHDELERSREANRYLLRRNTHRLEKGLLMRPRRDIFALKYIGKTIDAYERCLETFRAEGGDRDEMRWSHDVLREYFDVTGSDPIIDPLRERFRALPGIDPDEDREESKPYLRDLEDKPVEYDDFYRLARRRRSVRWFLQKPVPRELIDRAIVAAAESPSACNRQPFKFRIFDDPELIEQVATLPMGTRGFAHNFPAIVVVVGQLRAYFHPRDRHLIYIDGSLAAMSFMFALETLGLSSCPINWPDIPAREKQMAETLDLAPDQRPVMLIAVGYPDPEGAVAYSHKQSLDDLRSYNEA